VCFNVMNEDLSPLHYWLNQVHKHARAANMGVTYP
jgi:hypothetical protein